ncbi:precorrin-6y C5,15-methyltransferase (decarboxylating) subunit CbiE [Meridianimarinicoccus sp. RP-17]|uniref:precorrin-6y C5,15-methyltransferase (decarboxylating) subunit CbiE n=1 Tax=Meridianimarinicoccus zhengii TaxID=2056810 RepID=UPI000DAD7A37|nr:precorrin-6y C5,15-methyltransferase (decarboxylating) subunit CbiE [Phycocomes zhengii]
MTAPWLDIIGMGDDGRESLLPAARDRLAAAEVVIASARLHDRLPDLAAERIAWPTPFDALIDRLRDLRGRRVAVLATGDPLWFSVGARIAQAFDLSELRIHPQVSAFQLACARLGWPMSEVETLTAHGRAPERILPFVARGARLLVLTADSGTPARVARLLTDRGYGASVLTVLAHMGGADEARVTGLASGWDRAVPDFHVLAVECVADADAQITSRAPGLPDDLFQHDGKITKREVRAITLAKLMPQRGALLWDIGAGCGSVGIEWMRAATDARAIGIETREDRRDMAQENALALGVPDFDMVLGRAPDVLADLPPPEAVFIGGGLSDAVADAALAALKPLGRLVANAVTLESEGVLAGLHARLGGELTRIAVARARPVGGMTGWGPLMPVTQWSLIKQ